MRARWCREVAPLNTRWLNGADVVVLPDNDDVGRQHAVTVARSVHSLALRVRVLTLPKLLPKGDMFDWLQAGGTAEQLIALSNAAPIYSEAAAERAEEAPSQAAGAKPLVLIDPRLLAGVPIPPRHGSQQLMTCCAAGAYWAGLTTRRCKVFALFCEDDATEVHRRQDRINDALGIDWSDLGNMRWTCAVGGDNTLIRFEADGSWKLTTRFHQVVEAAQACGAELVVLDTAADLFGGNENDRQQVRAFLGQVLTKLAIDLHAAVLLNAHPSRSGMSAGGDLDGGSTAWSNTARSRWSLTRPPAEDGAEPDPDARILTRRKANYASIGDAIRLLWR